MRLSHCAYTKWWLTRIRQFNSLKDDSRQTLGDVGGPDQEGTATPLTCEVPSVRRTSTQKRFANYYQLNRDALRERASQYYKYSTEAISVQKAGQRKANSDKERNRRKAYRSANRHIVTAWNRRRKATKINATPDSLTKEYTKQVATSANRRCLPSNSPASSTTSTISNHCEVKIVAGCTCPGIFMC